MPERDSSPSRAADWTLFHRLRSGDARALQELIDALWHPLTAYARRILADQCADAEEAVQDAFLRLWAKRGELREEGSPRAFLYTVVRNACLDELRRNARRTRAEGGAPLPTPPRTPWEDVQGAELHRAAAGAVAGLPERRREVYRLAREEGLSYEEIAEILGLSRRTVANHMSLALADLRTALRPHLPQESRAGRPEVRRPENGAVED